MTRSLPELLEMNLRHESEIIHHAEDLPTRRLGDYRLVHPSDFLFHKIVGDAEFTQMDRKRAGQMSAQIAMNLTHWNQ